MVTNLRLKMKWTTNVEKKERTPNSVLAKVVVQSFLLQFFVLI